MSPPPPIRKLFTALFLALAVTSHGAPLLAYTFTRKTTGTSFLHDPAKPMYVRAESITDVVFIVRDLEEKTEIVFETALIGKAKYFKSPLATAGDYTSVRIGSYLEETRRMAYSSSDPFKNIGVEGRFFGSAGGGVVTMGNLLGRDSTFLIANPLPTAPKNVISITAPKTFTLTGKSYVDRTIEAGTVGWPSAGNAVSLLSLSGSQVLSVPNSTAVNNADAKDTTAPATLLPGTLPYAAYRMTKILTAAKYLPLP